MKARAHRALACRRLRRSPYDREILSLALPALGALAAEPLYLLADTAMVGHLGTEELAALAIAATLLAGTFTLFNFLTYGTTAQVARYHGAGDELVAGRLAAQALWLSTGIGACLTALVTAALPISEYTPMQMKQAVAGTGKAAKTQVQLMVQRLLQLPAMREWETAGLAEPWRDEAHEEEIAQYGDVVADLRAPAAPRA